MIEKLPEPLGVGTPKYTEFNNMLSKINELVDAFNKLVEELNELETKRHMPSLAQDCANFGAMFTKKLKENKNETP